MKDRTLMSLNEILDVKFGRLLTTSSNVANNSPPRTNNSSTGTGGKMTSTPSDIHARLCAPFDKSEEKTRKQKISKKDEKPERYIELTYVDSRAVQQRLDEVVGTDGWQSRMVMNGEKVACELSIKFGDVWITKTDGAGETDIEGEKGSFSDAFKRAAVMFGVGRYLYEGKGAKRPTSVANAVLAGVDRAPEPVIDEAEMQMRKMLNKLGDDVINLEDAQLERDEILFSFSAEEKIQLWQRFDAAERKAIKQLKLDW